MLMVVDTSLPPFKKRIKTNLQHSIGLCQHQDTQGEPLPLLGMCPSQPLRLKVCQRHFAYKFNDPLQFGLSMCLSVCLMAV